MSAAIFMLPLMVFIALISVVIPVVIGVYVYRDAKSRGMDAVLWTIIAVLAPSFIGLIVYLIIRGEHSNCRCAQCGAQISAEYAICPYCGASQRNRCEACGAATEPGWHNCPRCGAELPPSTGQAPRRPVSENRMPGWVIALIIAVPVLFLLAILAPLFLNLSAVCLPAL